MEDLRLVVFDCDGTLVDSQNTIVDCMTRAFEASRLAAPDRQSILATVGLPLEEGIESLLMGTHGDAVANVVATYRSVFFEMRTAPDFEEPLFPGVLEVVKGLDRDGWLLGVATGKSRRGLAATLDRHDLARYFFATRTADDGPGKPSPEILLDLLRHTGVRPERCVMVGDTVFDIEMANNAGTKSVGVSWGYHPAERLREAGAGAVVGSAESLMTALRQAVPGGGVPGSRC